MGRSQALPICDNRPQCIPKGRELRERQELGTKRIVHRVSATHLPCAIDRVLCWTLPRSRVSWPPKDSSVMRTAHPLRKNPLIWPSPWPVLFPTNPSAACCPVDPSFTRPTQKGVPFRFLV